jgi:hypothetical protein
VQREEDAITSQTAGEDLMHTPVLAAAPDTGARLPITAAHRTGVEGLVPLDLQPDGLNQVAQPIAGTPFDEARMKRVMAVEELLRIAFPVPRT